MNNVINRMMQGTPKFFRHTSNLGLIFSAIATTLATAPVALTALIAKVKARIKRKMKE